MCDIYLNLELMRADLKYIFQYYSLHSRHLVEGGHDAFCSYAAVLPAAERHFKRSEEAGAVDDCSSCFHSRSYFENTQLERPNFEALAISMASSSVSKPMMETTGPKISMSFATSAVLGISVITVGS